MNTDTPVETRQRRRRRRVGISVALMLVVSCGAGALWVTRTIQNDLRGKVNQSLAANGVQGVTVKFSGQDATLHCSAQLVDPIAVKERVGGIEGVRLVRLDSVCMGDSVSATTDPGGSAPGSTAAPLITPVVTVRANGTVELSGFVASLQQGTRLVDTATQAYGAVNVEANLTVGNGASPQNDKLVEQLAAFISVFPGKLSAGEAGVANDRVYVTGTAIDDAGLEALTGAALTDGVAASDVRLSVDQPHVAGGLALAAELADGRFVLTGSVSTEAQKLVLVEAADRVLGSLNVTSEIVVQIDASGVGQTVDELTVANLAQLIAAMPPNLLSGTAGFDGSKLYAKGVYIEDATKTVFVGVASGVGVQPLLEGRPTATSDDAASIQRQLNDYVAANPILFQSDKALLTPEAGLILDRVAAIAKQFAGTTIEVQGHTDSTGDPARNLRLSQGRADAVVAALATRGVPFDQLVGTGYGLTRPKVPNDTDANRTINRRVEFVVTTN